MSNDAESVNKKNLSQVPSWLMVGFVIGVFTMWAFRSPPAEPESSPPPPGPSPEEAKGDPSPTLDGSLDLETVAALFATYRDWVWWTDDRTEIAIWNSVELGFTDHYEVIRTMEADYFRPIAGFSRLPLPGYGPEKSPILFTETAEQRARREIELNPDLAPKVSRPDPIEFNTLPPPPSGN